MSFGRYLRPIAGRTRARSTVHSLSKCNISLSSKTSPNNSSFTSRFGRRYAAYGAVGAAITLLSYSLLPHSVSSLNPQSYSTHTLGTSKRLSPQHVLITIPITPAERLLFSSPAEEDRNDISRNSGTPRATSHIVVQHVMIKSPDLQIERPYTPINDVTKEGELSLIVKRVRGGEVGRLVHSLQPGDEIGLRGPIATFSLDLAAYDKIIMISTGTAVAPFLQLLAKSPPASPTTPKFHLIHASPIPGSTDIAYETQARLVPLLEEKFGEKLVVERPQLGAIGREVIHRALENSAAPLILVCLPPTFMRPLCGTLTPNLEQGPVTGLLADMGLSSGCVWKLE